MFELRTNLEDETIKLMLVGALDMNGVDIFEDEMSKIEFQNVRKVYIDFTGVDFIDSTGIGSIVNSLHLFGRQGVDYELLHVSDEIQEVFAIIGLEDILS
ncbi:STAS domain-containing protein [Alicyclobacillus fodiniaquatilis]|uniref:Anti-sigma factor antagonist n=1 Tax=Alicyclobacillus fodiniaquatilis TaxID=1661150 RepID=A0ABW4JJR1_9BACL